MATTRQGTKRRARGRKPASEQSSTRPSEFVSVAPEPVTQSVESNAGVADLQAALDYLREGDVFIVHSLDRLSQAMEELRAAVLGLTGRGLVVDLIKDLLDLSSGPDPMVSKRLITAINAISELQREMVRNRQKAVQDATSTRKGRRPSLSMERAVELRRRAAAGENKSLLAQEFGISRDTLYRYLTSL